MKATYDLAIIGGGILGLATGLAFLRRRPGAAVVVLEKEAELARHQTGRNSGVLHAGIYYTPGSLKAKLAVRGKRQLEAFAERHGVPVVRCGKLVIARDASELSLLRDLGARARANGVEGIREVSGSEIAGIEPNARGFAALHSPGTAITDFRRLALAMAEEVQARQGEVRVRAEVRGLDERGGHVRVTSTAGDLTARRVVSCAGLQSDRVAALTGPDGGERIVPFRGSYVRVRGGGDLVRGNIYPVPDPRFPFLGVHLTRRLDGEVWAGPNALLALSREGYHQARFRLGDVRGILAFPGFWHLARRHVRLGLAELWRHLSQSALVDDLRAYVPDVTADVLEPGPNGIRAQSVRRDGTLVDDFSFSRSEQVLHVRNAPSPGATASLAIGEEIAERLLR